MVEIKGKRGRKVPLLLTEEVKQAMDVLVETRCEVGINPENPTYLQQLQMVFWVI